MKQKNIVIVVMLVLLLLLKSMPINAREDPLMIATDDKLQEPTIRYVDVQSLKGGLDISSSGKASVFGQILARTANKTKVEIYLKRYINGSWVTYKKWSKTESSRVCTVAEDYYIPKGYQYKLYVYGYAWVNDTLVDSPNYITESLYY